MFISMSTSSAYCWHSDQVSIIQSLLLLENVAMHTEMHAGFRVYNEGTLVFSTVWFVCGYFGLFLENLLYLT